MVRVGMDAAIKARVDGLGATRWALVYAGDRAVVGVGGANGVGQHAGRLGRRGGRCAGDAVAVVIRSSGGGRVGGLASRGETLVELGSRVLSHVAWRAERTAGPFDFLAVGHPSATASWGSRRGAVGGAQRRAPGSRCGGRSAFELDTPCLEAFVLLADAAHEIPDAHVLGREFGIVEAELVTLGQDLVESRDVVSVGSG